MSFVPRAALKPVLVSAPFFPPLWKSVQFSHNVTRLSLLSAKAAWGTSTRRMTANLIAWLR